MNAGRIVMGGLVAGLVMNVIDFCVNAVMLAKAWNSESEALNPRLLNFAMMGAIGWVVTDFVLGLLTIWLYAAIRPRFGAGPKTAILAGAMVWLIAHVMFASNVFLGMFSMNLIIAASLGGLVASIGGALVGGALYKEA